MREKLLSFLGLMRRAGALAVGETNTGAAVRAGKAKLLLLAADASENARGRAETFIRGRRTQLVPLPFAKAELETALGLGGCSMAAVTELGFADALMKQLAAFEPERYEAPAGETARRREKAERRRRETAARKENERTGKRRTNE